MWRRNKMLVESTWLVEQILTGNKLIRLIDCRFDLSDATAGKNLYMEGHIPGACFFDLEKDLSSPAQQHGGRHPLPDLAIFKEKLEQYGIKNDDILVAYDGGQYAFAARFAWMMKYVGHEKVYILNGGFPNWAGHSFPITKDIPQNQKSVYQITIDTEILATYEEVKEISSGENSDVILIDCRERKRYLGLEEQIDKKAGHIPRAENCPFMEGIENGFFLRKEKQAERFSKWKKDQPIIIYCGSGITAMPNYFALKEAGYNHVKVYIGSFSDWISYEENEIATEK